MTYLFKKKIKYLYNTAQNMCSSNIFKIINIINKILYFLDQ